jgi:hypothetical protein
MTQRPTPNRLWVCTSSSSIVSVVSVVRRRDEGVRERLTFVWCAGARAESLDLDRWSVYRAAVGWCMRSTD